MCNQYRKKYMLRGLDNNGVGIHFIIVKVIDMGVHDPTFY